MNKVTVVIPNYNGIKYMKNCLESLYRQQTSDNTFPVIIVDNGSSDGSPGLVESQFPDADVIRLDKNTGFSHAVNVGIRAAVTPYVILLNNDTVVKTGFVENLVRSIEESEKIFAVSSKMLMWDNPGLVDDAGDRYCALGWAFSRGKGKPAAQYERPAEVFAACGGAAIYRRSVFEKIGYFDEAHFMYLEDIDICYRAQIYGYHSRYEPQAQVIHAGSASSGSRYNTFKTKYSSANSVYLIGKNMPLFQLLLNLPFLMIGFLVKTVFFIPKKMGMLYVKGLVCGLKRCLSKKGQAEKVKFSWSRFGNYIAIQGQLYANMFRLFDKS